MCIKGRCVLAVVAFDHEQLWFTPGGQLLPASQDNVAACEVGACVYTVGVCIKGRCVLAWPGGVRKTWWRSLLAWRSPLTRRRCSYSSSAHRLR